MQKKKKLIITAVLIAIAICTAVVVDALGYIIPAPDSYIGDVVAENGKTYRQFKTYNILGKTKLGIDGYSFTYDAGNDWLVDFNMPYFGMLDTYQYSKNGSKFERFLQGNSYDAESLTAIEELYSNGLFIRDDCRTEKIGKNSIGGGVYKKPMEGSTGDASTLFVDMDKSIVCDILDSLAAQLFSSPDYGNNDIEQSRRLGTLFIYTDEIYPLYNGYYVVEYEGNYYIECPPYIFGRFILSDSSVFYRAYRLPQSAVDVMFGEGA